MSPRYVIVQAPAQSESGYMPYGGAAEFWRYRGPETILSGPYETGKTLAALQKLHVLMAKYPNARGLMVRKTYKSLVQSAVVTYEQKVLPYPPGHRKCPVRAFGAVMPQWYGYPNGSKIILGGLDKADKFLSSEFDFIYVNQAEEIALNAWETLTGRATGRAGNTPWAQVMGDCNPGPSKHWIRTRAQVKLFTSRHEDNPTLFEPDTGEITEQGRRTMATLDALTGVRHKRGRLGLWVAAEGQVYEIYDPDVHVWPRSRYDPRQSAYTVAGVDWGYTNPGVISVWGVDGDKRMVGLAEVYRTGKLIDWWVRQAKRLKQQYGIRYFACDPSGPAYIEEFKRAGLRAFAGDNRIDYGIQKVEARLQVQADGLPRLAFLEDMLEGADPALQERHLPVCLTDEIVEYVYPLSASGRPLKELPLDEKNHGADAMRYVVMAVEEGPPKSRPGLLAHGKSRVRLRK